MTEWVKDGDNRTSATIEHFDDDCVVHPSKEKIAMCCMSCNTSRGAKRISDWFNSVYCRERNINEDTVASIVKEWLKLEPIMFSSAQKKELKWW
ncbi:hypothetical protein ACFLQI_01540 [Candidatus Undinarchaeota archaeon]